MTFFKVYVLKQALRTGNFGQYCKGKEKYLFKSFAWGLPNLKICFNFLPLLGGASARSTVEPETPSYFSSDFTQKRLAPNGFGSAD